MHEQTTIVPLALSDGVTTNLTVHLHLHVGPAVAPVNGEPPGSAPATHTIAVTHAPATPRIAVADRPGFERQMSPPRPSEMPTHRARPQPAEPPAADSDASIETDAVHALVGTGVGQRHARQLVAAAVSAGMTSTESVLRHAFTGDRSGNGGDLVTSITPAGDAAQPTSPEPASTESKPAPEPLTSPEAVTARDACQVMAAGYTSLSKVERRILPLYLAGRTCREISFELQTPEKTVRRRTSGVETKLGEDFLQIKDDFEKHLSHRGSELCIGCIFRCEQSFGPGNEGGDS